MSRSKQQTARKQAEHKKMIAEANARHDAVYGANPVIVKYATHTPGKKDITQKR